MRLTDSQRKRLTDATLRHFRPGSRLWLFGSRTDDAVRGGDFDLMVWSDEPDAQRLYDAKLLYLADLHATPDFEGEHIDLVLYSPHLDPVPRPVQQAALAHGMELTL